MTAAAAASIKARRPSGSLIWKSDDRTYADLKAAETFSNAIHPDNVAGFNVALHEVVREGGHFYREYRVIQGDRVRWISAQGHVTLDGSRRPMRFPGVILDLTPKRIVPPLDMALN